MCVGTRARIRSIYLFAYLLFSHFGCVLLLDKLTEQRALLRSSSSRMPLLLCRDHLQTSPACVVCGRKTGFNCQVTGV